MTSLSTHVLDTVAGRPAAGVAIALHHGETLIATGETDADGRWRAPGVLEPGVYRLTFAIGAYFGGEGIRFLDQVPIVFGLGGEGHCHVPLLASPHAYSTYRGS
jgi:5-hydroxyisourate hydrolase